MVLASYKLNSAIERGTRPDALGRKPCHWTNTWQAAMVNASRAWKYAQTRCMAFCNGTATRGRKVAVYLHPADKIVHEDVRLHPIA